MNKNIKVIISGSTLILIGVLFNEWFFAHNFSDGAIESSWKRIIIWLFDISFILFGAILIIKRNKINSISFKNILLTFLSIIFSFILAEILFRIFYPVVSPVDQLFNKSELFKPKPYVMFGGVPNYDGLNNLGYKDVAPSIVKQENEFRIFILGASTIYDGKPTITKLLQDEFQKNKLSDVRCYNFGLPASTSGIEMARIVYEIYDYKPDIILMYNGGNDIMINTWADPRPGYPYNFFIYENNPLLVKDIFSYPAFSLMLYSSKLLRHFFPSYFISTFTNFNQLKKNVSYSKNSWKDKIADVYVDNLVKSQKISKGFNSEFIVFFQPLIYFKDHLSDKENKIIKSTNLKTFVTQMHTKVFNRIDSVKKQYDLNVVDLSNMFDQYNEQIYTDDIHVLQKTNTIIANKIYNQLILTFGTEKFNSKNKRQ